MHSLNRAFQFAKDRICRGRPDEGFGSLVVFLDVGFDCLAQLSNRRKTTATNRLSRDLPQKPLNQVEPRTTGRGEVNLETGTAGKPTSDPPCFVSAVIVHDEMELGLAVIGKGLVNPIQKAQELLLAMTLVAVSQDAAGGGVVGRKQGQRAVAYIIVGLSLWQSGPQRQDRLGTLQRLGLALLVDTQHHRLVWRVKVKGSDIAYLLDKHWVAGKLESFADVRLQTERMPNPQHRMLRNSRLLGHLTTTPMRVGWRCALQSAGDDFL